MKKKKRKVLQKTTKTEMEEKECFEFIKLMGNGKYLFAQTLAI